MRFNHGRRLCVAPATDLGFRRVPSIRRPSFSEAFHPLAGLGAEVCLVFVIVLFFVCVCSYATPGVTVKNALVRPEKFMSSSTSLICAVFFVFSQYFYFTINCLYRSAEVTHC